MAAQGIMEEPGTTRHAVSAAVLAGGESRRMGRDKRSLLIGTETLLARVTARLRAVSDDVLIACRDAAQVDLDTAHALGARRVVDRHPGAGPLAGIASALLVARHAHVVVVAVDMPFVSIELLRLVATVATDRDRAVVVRSPRGVEPLIASYPRAEAQRADAMLARGERQVAGFVDALRPTVIERERWSPLDPDGASFVNWNRPADVRVPLQAEPLEALG